MTRHSRPEVEALRGMAAAGTGGVRLVAAVGEGPFYAGIDRAPAGTLLEATLCFLPRRDYREIVVASGSGRHLPALDLGGGFRVGVVPGIWCLTGAGRTGSSGPRPGPGEDDDLLTAEDVAGLMVEGAGTRVLSNHQNAPWWVRIEELLGRIAIQAGFDWQTGRRTQAVARTLIVVDDVYLGIEAARVEGEEVPSAWKQRDLEDRFSRLPSLLAGCGADLVVLCGSRERAEALVAGRFLAAFAGGGTDGSRLGRFPALGLPEAAVSVMAGMGGETPWGENLRGAPVDLDLRSVLRKVAPTRPGGPLRELERLVGVEDVKRQVRGLWVDASARARRRSLGLASAGDTGLHTVLLGNPGTGKTTVARILAGIWAELGLLPTRKLVEVTRADLVAEYVGQTAPRTREVCERALGGVLFIDEAYGLARGGPQDFGREAIEELLRWMSERKGELAVVAAGYPEPMRRFLAANEGFARRFARHILFPDYRDEELLEIVHRTAARHDDRVEPEADPVILGRLAALREGCARVGQAFGNAGEAEKLLAAAQSARNWRLRNREDAGREEWTRLTAEDFGTARVDLPGEGASWN